MHQFLIHNRDDDVGVATEDIKSGEQVTGICLDTDEAITLTALADIPLGHKIAVNDISAGGDVSKYGVKIGLARQGIAAGEYVHVHNIRSARWSFDG